MSVRPFALGLLLFTATAALAAPGAGELQLDRAAVQSLLRAALPETLYVSVPGVGELTVRLDPPQRLEFSDGGIEARLGFVIEPFGYSGSLHARYLPTVDRKHGIVKLIPERVTTDGTVPLPIDLAALVPPAELPRWVGGTLPTPNGGELDVRCFVQGVVVEDERLVIEFGLLVR